MPGTPWLSRFDRRALYCPVRPEPTSIKIMIVGSGSLARAAAVVLLAAAFTVSGHAQQDPRASRHVALETFTDDRVASLIHKLDRDLAPLTDPATWGDGARFPLWDFARTLQAGQLTASQAAQIRAHLEAIAGAHPRDADLVARSQHMLDALSPGHVAPEIVGRDLDGRTLKLSDFRGKVVVLVFSGNWCGICRSNYPYERRLLELFKGRPFAIVGVNSDADPAAAQRAQEGQGLTFRSWWDGKGAKPTDGPIASAWNVVGWPTVYVIDVNGVIRFVDLHQDDLLAGVGQLLSSDPQ